MYRALRSAPRFLRTAYLTSSRSVSSAQPIDSKVQEVPKPQPIDAKTKADMECPAEENNEQNLEHGVNSKFAAMCEHIQKEHLQAELDSYSSTKGKGKSDTQKTDKNDKKKNDKKNINRQAAN